LSQIRNTFRALWKTPGAMLTWHRDASKVHLYEVLPHSRDMAKIQDYGIIGDCRSAALVSKYGSIDWLAWPKFDSPSIFAAVLDPAKGGYWSISPVDTFQINRNYIRETNVLQTRFFAAGGEALLTDVMPVTSEEAKRLQLWPDHELVRTIRCTEGELEARIEFVPRAEYGLGAVEIRASGKLGLRMEVGRGAYWLRSSVPVKVQGCSASAVIRLKKGEEAQFSLTYSEESPTVLPMLGREVEARIGQSVEWWQQWARTCSYDGQYRDSVVRSALALKLLSYAPSGAITAAATTSLPEIVGADLNWDYRYCWLRDASLTIRAMLGLGYIDEAESFITWLLHATRITQPKLRVLYTIFGEIAPAERLLNHLSGYESSRPVRVGNLAREQLQLDIYGEVIDAAAQFVRESKCFDRTTQSVLIGFGRHVAKNWDQPDEGIWEPRTGRENHTHSRLMCWTALDRLLEMSHKGRVKGVPVDLFTRERDRIREQLEARAWNESKQSYVSTLDGDSPDATLLRIPWYGLERADTARMRSTYSQVRRELGAGDCLLYRYNREPHEGAFGICGFWAAEYLAIGGGSLQEAKECFEELLRYGNDLGLMSEETDPNSGDALGNFPQAFTHVGLISAALSIREREKGEAHPAEKRHAVEPVGVGEEAR
jgi:GH15 family glucan-1,4-alpha-glucosidase